MKNESIIDLPGPTPSQTIGPFFAYGLTPEQYHYDFRSIFNPNSHTIASEEDQITLTGRVFDGQGEIVLDAMIEICHSYGKEIFFGRCGTGSTSDGRYSFHTFKPRPDQRMAPYIDMILFMRGQLIHSFTRVYFSDEMTINKRDAIFQIVPEERKHTLIARKNGALYEFDIHMQGDDETVFFEYPPEF